jgi:hypothetical protein
MGECGGILSLHGNELRPYFTGSHVSGVPVHLEVFNWVLTNDGPDIARFALAYRATQVIANPLGRLFQHQLMPIISAFFGIVIRMHYKDHEPAHFHAEYARQQAKFDFEGELVAGVISSRKAHRRIRVWARAHRAELEANWAK